MWKSSSEGKKQSRTFLIEDRIERGQLHHINDRRF